MLHSLMCRTVSRKTLPHISCSISTLPSSHLLKIRPLPTITKPRRYSSSKPSSPSKNNSRSITTPANDPAKGDSIARKRAYSKPGRPKSKDGSTKSAEVSANAPAYSLPSVPSTEHLNHQDVYIASLFSLHRPISVLSPVPTTTTAESFSSIFSSRTSSKPRTTEVIYTLSSAIQNLDKSAAQAEKKGPISPAQRLTPAEADLRHEVTQASQSNAEPTHLDGQPVYVSLEDLAKKFRPFVPPPAPVPLDDDVAWKHFKQSARASPITHLDMPAAVAEEIQIEDRQSIIRQPFLDRMRARHAKWEKSQESRSREIWLAISVRRQRKLKMKKHKYKKLMRRTRNLRRRQDRL